MKKALRNLALLIFAVASLFFALSQVDWIAKLNIKSLPSINEKKIGDFIWENSEFDLDLFSTEGKPHKSLVKLSKKLILSNQWCDTIYQIHLNNNAQVNAFAFPGGHIVINTALVKKCNTEGELLSVIAHETAHLNENHPIELLKREIGISVLSSIILGEKSRHVISQATKTLALSSYQRDEEALADSLGLIYLAKSDKNPIEFINFQKAMSKDATDYPEAMVWLQSHPEWETRIDRLSIQISSLDSSTIKNEPILTDEEWSNLKEACE